METSNAPLAAPNLGAVLAKTITPTAWIEFKEGISLQLRYMPKSRFRAIADKHTEMVYSEATKARAQKINTEEYTKSFIKEAVLGWKGVTLKSLSRLCEIDISSYTAEQLEMPLPFSTAEMLKLLDLCYDLDGFISQSVSDIRMFRPNLEDEAKNLKSSPTTS